MLNLLHSNPTQSPVAHYRTELSFVLTAKQHKHLVWVLMLGNFVIGTGAMMVAGMLNELSTDLLLPVTVVAQLLTAFALVCAIGAPLLAVVLSAMDRRTVLVGALLVYALGHGIAMFTQSFAVLLALRAFVAIGAAIFTPQAAAAIGMLTAAQHRGKAVGLVFLGWGLASVIGLPLGSWLALAYHWHVAMALASGLALLAAALVYRVMPAGVQGQATDLKAFRVLLLDPKTVSLVGVTVLSACGLFCMFAYLAPLLRGEVGVSASLIPWLFACYGLAGVLGTAVVTQIVDRQGAATIVAWCLAATVTMLVLWPLAKLHVVVVFCIAFAWGLPGFATNGTQQTRLMAMAGSMAPVAVSFNSSALYLGQAVGTVAGGIYYAHNSVFAPRLFLPWLAAGFVALAWVLSRRAQNKYGV